MGHGQPGPLHVGTVKDPETWYLRQKQFQKQAVVVFLKPAPLPQMLQKELNYASIFANVYFLTFECNLNFTKILP